LPAAGAKPGEGGRSALDQLDERYARGEIDREEYLERKKDITER
jgi:putative membrane protein